MSASTPIVKSCVLKISGIFRIHLIFKKSFTFLAQAGDDSANLGPEELTCCRGAGVRHHTYTTRISKQSGSKQARRKEAKLLLLSLAATHNGADE